MSDRLVEVAAFSMPVEAHAARGLLEAEGIHAVLAGEASVGVFGGVPAGGRITLHVVESDAERAVGILAAVGQGADDDEDGGRLWVCPLCGDAVGDEFSVCPACGTHRPEAPESTAVTGAPRPGPTSENIQEGRRAGPSGVTADTPLEAVPSAVEDDLDLPDPETFIGDDLVRRAFRSALFGFLVPYSVWLLVRLAFYPGKISPRMMPRLYLTIAIDSLWCLFLLLAFCILVPR